MGSTVQPFTVFGVFSDAISDFGNTFVMLFGALSQGMAGAIGLSSFPPAFFEPLGGFSLIE